MTNPCQGLSVGPTPTTRSMLFRFFSKITRHDTLTRKINSSETDVHLYILFPITVTFLIAFTGARVISHFDPGFFIHIVPGLHIHHFAYGIIILAMSGYLALVNNSARSKYLIALIHGLGLGLAFDEFGLWLRLSDNSAARYSYDGVVVLIAFFILMISAKSGVLVWNRYFSKKAEKGAQY